VTEKPRIALWGAGSLKNWGDQLIARITEEQLRGRIPEAQFVHFCPWTNDQALQLRFNADGQWPLQSSFNAVVVVGGGIFAGPPFKHPMMQLFCFGPHPALFAPRLFTAWNAVGLQDDTWTADTLVWTGYRTELRSRLDYCSVRTIATAERIGFRSGSFPQYIVPDSVYALPPLEPRKRPLRKRLLGVSLGSPFPSREFLSGLAGSRVAETCPFEPSLCMTPAEFVAATASPEDDLRKRNLLPHVVSQLKKIAHSVQIEFFGFGEMYGDCKLAGELSSQIPGSQLRTIPAGSNYNDIQEFLSSYDALVLSRFHAAIFAHRAGMPFVAIDPHWSCRTGSSKLQELMHSINLGPLYWNGTAGPGEQAALSAMFERLFDNRHTTDPIPYAEFHQKSLQNFDRLASALLRGREKVEEEQDPANASMASLTHSC
jgi:hypothetical protein